MEAINGKSLRSGYMQSGSGQIGKVSIDDKAGPGRTDQEKRKCISPWK